MKQGNINIRMPFIHFIMIYTGGNADEKKVYVPMYLFNILHVFYWGKYMVVIAHERKIKVLSFRA